MSQQIWLYTCWYKKDEFVAIAIFIIIWFQFGNAELLIDFVVVASMNELNMFTVWLIQCFFLGFLFQTASIF